MCRAMAQKGMPTGSDISFKHRRDSVRWMRPIDPNEAMLPSVEHRPSRALAALKSAGSMIMREALVLSAFQNKPASMFDALGKEPEARPEMVLINQDTALDETADLVLQALRKPSSERTDDDLQTILQATADTKFFQRLSPEQHRELCRVMQPTFVPQDTLVFQQGDEGKSFYVIYHGAAKVYVKHPPKVVKPTLSMMDLNPKKLGAQAAIARKLDSNRTQAGLHIAIEKSEEEEEQAKLGSYVCALEDGDSFGELALTGVGKRQASVQAAMPTHLLEICKVEYDRCLRELHEAELDRRVKFVRSIWIFESWSEAELRRISEVMTTRQYEKNTTIIKQAGRLAHSQP